MNHKWADRPPWPASAGDRSMAHTWPTLKTRWAKRPSSIPRWLPARLHAWLHETSQILCVEGLVACQGLQDSRRIRDPAEDASLSLDHPQPHLVELGEVRAAAIGKDDAAV